MPCFQETAGSNENAVAAMTRGQKDIITVELTSEVIRYHQTHCWARQKSFAVLVTWERFLLLKQLAASSVYSDYDNILQEKRMKMLHNRREAFLFLCQNSRKFLRWASNTNWSCWQCMVVHLRRRIKDKGLISQKYIFKEKYYYYFIYAIRNYEITCYLLTMLFVLAIIRSIRPDTRCIRPDTGYR